MLNTADMTEVWEVAQALQSQLSPSVAHPKQPGSNAHPNPGQSHSDPSQNPHGYKTLTDLAEVRARS